MNITRRTLTRAALRLPLRDDRERNREPCPVCDRPTADDTDMDTVPEGGRDDLCWQEVGGGDPSCETVDWRARCLAKSAEDAETIAGLRAELEAVSAWLDKRNRKDAEQHDALMTAADRRAKQLDEVGKGVAAAIDAVGKGVAAAIDALAKERDELRAALENWCEHAARCAIHLTPAEWCDCGLSAAIGGTA